MATLSIGEREVDLARIAQKNMEAMLSRGIRHYLGNEVSARVGGEFKRAAVAAHKAANGGDIDADTRKAVEATAIPETDSPEYVAMKDKVFAEFVDTLYNGEVGLSERGPSVSPFDAEVRSIVKRDVMAILRSAKGADGEPLWKGKKDPTDETTFTFANGSKRDFETVKTTYLTKNEAKIHTEARKRLEAVQKAKDSAAKQAEQADELFS